MLIQWMDLNYLKSKKIVSGQEQWLYVKWRIIPELSVFITQRQILNHALPFFNGLHQAWTKAFYI